MHRFSGLFSLDYTGNISEMISVVEDHEVFKYTTVWRHDDSQPQLKRSIDWLIDFH